MRIWGMTFGWKDLVDTVILFAGVSVTWNTVILTDWVMGGAERVALAGLVALGWVIVGAALSVWGAMRIAMRGRDLVTPKE